LRSKRLETRWPALETTHHPAPGHRVSWRSLRDLLDDRGRADNRSPGVGAACHPVRL